MPSPVDISVVVPTLSSRARWLDHCLAAYERTAPGAEVLVVRDAPSCGAAWAEGARRSRRAYLHFTADDLEPHDGWAEAALEVAEQGAVPAARIVDRRGRDAGCNAPLGGLGDRPNVLVPFLSRALFDRAGCNWILADAHYGTDDWITYLAARLGLLIEREPAYAFTHHVAPEGRDYSRRPGDVEKLVAAMETAGYVPPAYRELLSRLATDPKAQAPRIVTPERPTLWAASQFKNELDVLEIKLGTIGDNVDRFVLAEATVDQRGRPRELVFPQHRERFAPWQDKIEYVVVDDMPTGTTHEDDVRRERHQRDALLRGMPTLRPDDLVYVSDLDEIPHPAALDDAFRRPPLRLSMDLHVYALNWRWLERGCRIGTLGAVVRGRDILTRGVCWAVLWDSRVPRRDGVSGWHLTYQGGVAAVRDKVEGMMDKWQELVPREWDGSPPAGFMSDEWIAESIRTGRDVFGREYRPAEWVDVTELPLYVLENIGRFGHMLVDRPVDQDEIEARPRCTCGAIYAPSGELAHFDGCALAQESGTLLHPNWRRRA